MHGRHAPKDAEREGSELAPAMTHSDQTRFPSSVLGRHVREIKTLWSAWITIRSKALRSSEQETRAAANTVDENPYGELFALQRQLRSGTFRFEPQKGVLKIRKGKKPRPLVISPKGFSLCFRLRHMLIGLSSFCARSSDRVRRWTGALELCDVPSGSVRPAGRRVLGL